MLETQKCSRLWLRTWQAYKTKGEGNEELHEQRVCLLPDHPAPASCLDSQGRQAHYRLSKNNHPLVVPKKHLPTIYELDELTAAQVMQAAVQIARAVKTGLPCEGVYLTQANEAAAGQDVFHFHLHVYPRWSNVDFAQQQAPEEVSEEERRAAWQKIRSALAKR